MSDTPFLAIDCLVYNHEPYLRECLDGFVMQQTNFPFVAIVHDDASTDKSADIIREYAAKYPDIIFPLYETENQYSKPDRALGRVMDAAIDATGAKYVAMCEGDDYWTDPYKLQRQVDFMEAHPAYSLCCHRYSIYNEDTKTWDEDYEADYFANGANPDGFAFTNADNLRCWIAKTNTLLYRHDVLCNDLLNQYHYSRDVHRVYHLLQQGDGYCLPWNGAVYRRQQGGVFSSLNSVQKQRTSVLIYTELLERNPQDNELRTYYRELYTVYMDTMRRRVQSREIDWHELLAFLRVTWKVYGLHGVAYAIRKFCLSWRKAINN